MVRVVKAFLQGLNRPIILWLLSRRPMHGYEIIKEFKRLTGRRLKPSIVYPFLHWLEREGFAISEWVTIGKRKVRCYSLTQKGRGLLRRVRRLLRKSINEILIPLR